MFFACLYRWKTNSDIDSWRIPDKGKVMKHHNKGRNLREPIKGHSKFKWTNQNSKSIHADTLRKARENHVTESQVAQDFALDCLKIWRVKYNDTKRNTFYTQIKINLLS